MIEKFNLIKQSIFTLTLISALSSNAQQPPRAQAIKECNDAAHLAASIAEIKNQGATKENIYQIKSMASDGQGIIGDLSIIFFDLHTKGHDPKKFSSRMYQRCMRSNGYSK